MAIYSAVPPPPEVSATTANSNQEQQYHQQQQQQQQQGPQDLPGATANPSSSGVDVEAWTISALESLNVASVARGTGIPLSFPVEDSLNKVFVTIQDSRTKSTAITPPQHPLAHRDSQRRREALLKGKEGSRQRRRWENGTYIPSVAPTLPAFCVGD